MRFFSKWVASPVYCRVAGMERLSPQFQNEDPDLFWLGNKSKLVNKIATFSSPSPKATVVAFGGSITQPHKFPEVTTGFPELLYQMMEKDGLKVRGANFGYSGYTTYQAKFQLDWLLKEGGEPDIVLVCNAFNDMFGLAPHLALSEAKLNHQWPRRLMYQLNRSYLISFYRYNFFRLFRSRLPTRSENQLLRMSGYEENLEAMATSLKEINSSFLLVSQPMTMYSDERSLKSYFDICQKVADRHSHVHFVDVRPRFLELRKRFKLPFNEQNPDTNYMTRHMLKENQIDYSDKLFRDGYGHHSLFGLQEIAKEIYQTILDKGLLTEHQKME